MAYLEYLLWGYFILNPLYIFLTYKQEKQSVIAQPSLRLGMYKSWMLHLILPVMVLMVLTNQTTLSLDNIGLKWQIDLPNLLGMVGVLVLCGYFLFSLKQLKNNTTEHPTIRKQLAYIQWMTPSNPREARYFIFGLSITAGICEEILFRGYLMHVLGGYFPTYMVVIISSLIFGLPHIYQGPIHILRTAIVGATMALIYLFTDSLIVPIILHALLDMYGGAMAYIVFSSDSGQQLEETLPSESQ
ncbi:MAG: CPBP family intramembrane glutamic endopeptidase [Paraglaciecola sp.]|uniref:CPBP family intramembrane glutamic endopeptidase n=1 Tax=Paraglaciecola sp. TaxID=1920173 RepID=UPI0032998745